MSNPDMKKLLLVKEDHEALKAIARERGMKMYSLFTEVLNDLRIKEIRRQADIEVKLTKAEMASMLKDYMDSLDDE